VADLGFLVELTVSIVLIVLPIVLIVLLLAGDDTAVGSLFALPTPDVHPRVPEEEPAPRWRTELLGARQPATEPAISRTAVGRGAADVAPPLPC